MDFSGLSNADRARMMQLLEEKQRQDSVRGFTTLTDRCFNDCVNDFTSRAMLAKEEECVQRCVDKFIRFSTRAGQRFQDVQQEMMTKQQQQQQ